MKKLFFFLLSVFQNLNGKYFKVLLVLRKSACENSHASEITSRMALFPLLAMN